MGQAHAGAVAGAEQAAQVRFQALGVGADAPLAARVHEFQDFAVAQHGDPVGKPHGFADAVRDEDGGQSGFVVQVPQFGVETFAHQGVQCAERFVEEQEVAALREGAGEGHTCPHTARELRREVGGVGAQADEVQGLAGFQAATSTQVGRKLHVPQGGAPRQQAVILKDQGRVAGHPHASRLGFQQSSDDAQQGAFPPAGRPDDGEEFAVRDGQGHVLQDGFPAEAHGDVLHLDGIRGGGHARPSLGRPRRFSRTTPAMAIRPPSRLMRVGTSRSHTQPIRMALTGFTYRKDVVMLAGTRERA